MSRSKRLSISWLAEASPNSSMIRLGLPAWTLSIAARIGAITSFAFSASPLTSNWTRAECRSTETRPARGRLIGETMFVTFRCWERDCTTPPTAAENAGSSMLDVRDCTSTLSRAAFYGVTQPAADYLRRANEETMFVPLLEDREVLDVLPDVVGVEGVDVVVIGPADLALSMGIPGGWSDPRVQAEVDRIARAARAAGRPAMIVALDPEDGRRLIDRGFQALLVPSGPVIAQAARSFLDALRA